MSSSLDEKRLQTTGGIGRHKIDSRRQLTPTTQTPAVTNTFHKLSQDYNVRKMSNTSSISNNSQSLRCKSSYAIKLSPLLNGGNSPSQERRSTGRRIQQQLPQRPQSQSVFQSADSEFAFIPTKSIPIKTLMPERNSYYLSRNSMSSSASLMLNGRHGKMNAIESYLSRNTPPPPVPPHRTHLHNF